MIDIADEARRAVFLVRKRCPYDTGNLKNNGIGDASSLTSAQAEFRINGTNAAPYAAILNEAPIINYGGKYPHANKHYMWIDKRLDVVVRYMEQRVQKAFGGKK